MLPKLKKVFWFLGLAVFLSVIFLPGYTKLQELKDRNSDSVVKARKLRIENALLKEQIRRMEEDEVYQERMAREKMGMVRKGEIPVKVIPEDNN